ncbi:Co2+/Mg2+ efflux protein ApaG [Candidatus Methylopumilus universalis]|jgi:ApaG protein|uniref:Protein ApaG n=1 Tax=Candidatus Methylopumilus universalis TaxID=2588536 RepID=A0ABX5VVS6_9PROT|nr:Co2+/Mg2+ efflux protein ApaG [Candidatus Methylopumilus universalis]MCF8161999.1 Co2+/Mg2+ efflux protein ApaG [Candidatus Methylopumilus sp.]QDC51635.1 Co2+/Mg2+ efflux protein ApaG [Candidatus Methylopumilus universalis]QDC61772.1 Co2+/Mg2+ efflux protein ApaG [Candidatus Methylopumilus universalis]QDC99526.1 Co2+/Mg2+ efflux protein ApaG [Candidatus Methylopumilus universalis]
MGSTKLHAIRINVETHFVEEKSSIEHNRYFFNYTVTISNDGLVPAQLVSRHWIITDANEETFEVKGLGVVGEQPLIQPHESYTYTSGTELNTPVGSMHGSYQMVSEDGTAFDAEIPMFILSMPRTLH